ncbi:MAG: hypothetical protein Q7T48_01065 [Cellvibrio sp.]|uniref:hypothetical protein n=1 Tax=Cellvibrio sp. TaxID=1965322 RepID=UPI002728DE04|nr:hypothetical protein [Cellvibrio sp.]
MSAYVIATIFVLLILLAGYLFLSHSIEKRRVQRQRLITALRARRNSFRDLATGFPAGFLSNDLTALLYRALIDCCEQLSRIEPKDPTHAEQFNLYTNLLATQKDNSQQVRVRLDNPQQIKEAHGLLQELHKFIMQQSTLKLINQVQTEAYVDQIHRLVLQMSVDGHVFNARQSQQVGKVRLAVHYYTLARKALAAENAGHGFDKQIAQLDSVIAKLQEKADATPEGAETPAATTAKPAAAVDGPSKEWKQFDEENDKWKKKQIYD